MSEKWTIVVLLVFRRKFAKYSCKFANDLTNNTHISDLNENKTHITSFNAFIFCYSKCSNTGN